MQHVLNVAALLAASTAFLPDASAPTGRSADRTADGKVAADLSAFDFTKSDAPPTVNPSLWRQAQLTEKHGLLRVTDDIWQARGFETANATLVRGRTGWVGAKLFTLRR